MSKEGGCRQSHLQRWLAAQDRSLLGAGSLRPALGHRAAHRPAPQAWRPGDWRTRAGRLVRCMGSRPDGCLPAAARSPAPGSRELPLYETPDHNLMSEPCASQRAREGRAALFVKEQQQHQQEQQSQRPSAVLCAGCACPGSLEVSASGIRPTLLATLVLSFLTPHAGRRLLHRRVQRQAAPWLRCVHRAEEGLRCRLRRQPGTHDHRHPHSLPAQQVRASALTCSCRGRAPGVDRLRRSRHGHGWSPVCTAWQHLAS